MCATDYIFRKIAKHEINILFDIIGKRVSWMDEVGIKQWNTTNYAEVYPTSYFEEKRQNDECFVLEEKSTGIIVAVAVLLKQDLRWPNKASALYLHNFATRIEYKGVGSICLELAEEYTKNKGYKYMRLDSDIDNKPLEEYYTIRGYKAVGSCVDGLYKGTLREKKL